MGNEIWKIKTRPSVVYEDSDLVAINKPWGLIVHPKNQDDKSYSVSQWFSENYPDSKDVGEPFILGHHSIPRSGIVHRLDRETSGLMVLAKSNESFVFLKKLFQDRNIEKHYQALVAGRPKNPSGVIDAPMGRIGIKRTTKIHGKKTLDEKNAVTEYKTIQNFDGYTLLDVIPRTGRTHQIRVHLKSIGHPLAGDTVYASRNQKTPPGLTRLFLHAWKLKLSTPRGDNITLEADLPEELQNVINMLK